MKKNNIILKTASVVLLALLGLFLLFPIYWMLVTSFKLNMDIYRFPPQWLPVKATLAHYIEILNTNAVILYFVNNFTVSFGTTLCTMAASVLAGYSLSRYPSVLGNLIQTALLSTQMFPIVGLILALYVIFRGLNLIDTRLSVILSLSAVTIPFCTILIKSFFDDISKSLEEAARIDGASRIRTLWSIILPLSKPGMLAIGLYTFMQAWDDFLFAITFILTDGKRTLTAGIAMRFLGEVSYDWGMVTAVSVTGVLPMFLLIFLFQKYMVAGLTAGSVKG